MAGARQSSARHHAALISRTGRRLGAAALLLVAVFSAACAKVDAGQAKLSASARFEALWWSPEQMDNLNPNSPPPKTTRVTLNKWEYTDPVGVPHPDTVDLVITIHNDGSSSAQATPRITLQWLDGPIKNRSKATWGPGQEKTVAPVDVPPGKSADVKLTIDLATRMKELAPSGRWPWALRAIITSAPDQAPTQVELPITPGD